MKTIAKIVIVSLILSMLTLSAANAQFNEEPNRLSAGIMGGATMGHFNIGTEVDPAFGFNLRYAANPVFAVQTNVMFGTFTTNDEDNNFLDRSFENSYVTTSVTSQIGLLRLLGSTSERVNVYANVGLGLIFNDVTTDVGRKELDIWTEFAGENHSERAMFATFGTGVRFNLGKRVDLFAQYDYNTSTSDLIDGFRTRPETAIDLNRRTPDSWSGVTAGLQIKFGSSSRDADWHNPAPTVSAAAFSRLESQLDQLAARMDQQGTRIGQNEENIRALEQRLDDLDEKLSNIHALLEEQESVELTIGNDVLFAFDSAVVRESAKPTLAQVARALMEHPERTVMVTGHTCDVGAASYNMGLSERRAAAVKNYLVESGIDASRIVSQGRGETMPLVPNTSEEARSLNRRVEMVIQ